MFHRNSWCLVIFAPLVVSLAFSILIDFPVSAVALRSGKVFSSACQSSQRDCTTEGSKLTHLRWTGSQSKLQESKFQCRQDLYVDLSMARAFVSAVEEEPSRQGSNSHQHKLSLSRLSLLTTELFINRILSQSLKNLRRIDLDADNQFRR